MRPVMIERAKCLAAETALTKSDMRYKHGAVLLVNGKLVAKASNARLRFGEDSLHAEARVLCKVPRGTNPRDITLIVARVNRHGARRYSKPCEQCEYLIRRAGIPWRNVYWTEPEASQAAQELGWV